jgi:hypothetical protein
MYCFIMQPWQTIRSSSAVASVTQTENCWLDLTPYQDIVAWLEVKEVSVGGGTNVQMAYQTSPTKDDSLFQAVVTAFNVATGVTTTVMLKDSVTGVPLCRWLRWQLTVTGTPTSTWDATFRIFIAANVVGRGGRPKAARGAMVVRPPTSSGPAGLSSLGSSAPLHVQQAVGSTYLGSSPAGVTQSSTNGMLSQGPAPSGYSTMVPVGASSATRFAPVSGNAILANAPQQLTMVPTKNNLLTAVQTTPSNAMMVPGPKG